MTIITSIVNSKEELAAFPLTGNVAFFISGPIDHLEDRLTVFRKEAVYPNISAYLYPQYGDKRTPSIPEYSVSVDASNKVTVILRKLDQSESYFLLVNNSDIYGDVVSSHNSGTGNVILKNYYIGAQQITSALLEVMEDSKYDISTGVFSTKMRFTLGSSLPQVRTVYSNRTVNIEGISAIQSSDLFLMGDSFVYSFEPFAEESLEIIEIKTSAILNSKQILENSSKQANELDLIAFYQEENQPVSPSQPTSIKRVLKSPRSMIMEFNEDIDLVNSNITMSVGPAFNIISIPEEQWMQSVKITVTPLSPRVLFFKFTDSELLVNEVVKNV